MTSPVIRPAAKGPPAAGPVLAPGPPIDVLVAAAASGDDAAWKQLVHRLMPLVESTIDGFGLDEADAAEVNQTVWLRVVEWLGHLRQPGALPSWIVTTTSRECERLLRTSRRTDPVGLYDDLVGRVGPATEWSGPDRGPEDAAVRDEQYRALRAGFAQLSPRCRELMRLLLRDPPMSYRDIETRIGMRVGSVGPTQGRCLDKLRASPAVAAYLGRGQ